MSYGQRTLELKRHGLDTAAKQPPAEAVFVSVSNIAMAL